MSFNDPLSDLIARIKNAAERKRSKVSTPASTLRRRVLDVLQDEGHESQLRPLIRISVLNNVKSK